MALVEGSISDGRVLALIDGFLQQEIMTEMARWQPDGGDPARGRAVPAAGEPLSAPARPVDGAERLPDGALRRRLRDPVCVGGGGRGGTASGNGVGDCQWPDPAPRDKTNVCDSRQPGQGFDFLGYRFEAGMRFVRAKSLKAFKDKVRARTIRSRGDSLGQIVADLNPMLRGWFEYFKHARPRLFRKLDGLIRRRLRAILRKQEKRPSAWAGARQIIEDGPMPSSRIRGCSPYMQPMPTRDTPDEETSDWRAVCGRTASTVRRAGRATFPTPIEEAGPAWRYKLWRFPKPWRFSGRP